MKLMISDGLQTRSPRRIGSLIFQSSPGGTRLIVKRKVKSRPRALSKNGESYFDFVVRYARFYASLKAIPKDRWLGHAEEARIPTRFGGFRQMRAINCAIRGYMASCYTLLGLEFYNPPSIPTNNYPGWEFRFWLWRGNDSDRGGAYIGLNGSYYQYEPRRLICYIFNGAYLVGTFIGLPNRVLIPQDIEFTHIRWTFSIGVNSPAWYWSTIRLDEIGTDPNGPPPIPPPD